MTLLLGSTVTRRRVAGGPDPVPDPGGGGPDPEPGWTYFTGAGVGPSGLRVPIPPGYKLWWYDFFAYADRNAMLAASFNGSPVWSVYSGQDGAYASGFWGTSHVTVAGNLLTLEGRFDTSVHATKYVTGGVGAWPFAQGGNAPAGALWLWCAREEAAGAVPVKTAVMTYGSQYPWAGQFAKNGSAAGSGYAEWPYCGEVDIKEGTQGAGSADANLHWHDPSLVSSGNPAGHAQVRLGGLNVDTTSWHILGYRVDAAGLYQGWTNDAGTTDAPLRKWIEQAGVNEAFRRAGRAWIYQQEAFGQPAAGTGTLRTYVDWVACLVPTTKGIWTPPGAIIDLKPWKTTHPLDATNGTTGTASEWTQPKLDTQVHGSFLFADPTGTGVRFIANAGGAKTGSSDFAREELREMNLDGTQAAWGSNDGKAHELTGVCQIDHLPDHRPILSFAQVHGPAAQSFLLLLADGFRGVAGSTYVQGGDTGTFSLMYKVNDASSTQVAYVTLLPNYTLGTPLSWRVHIESGICSVFADPGTGGATTQRGAPFSANVPASGMYGKAGIYMQSSTDNSGKTVPTGLTAPIASGQPTGNAALSEYGQVTYFNVAAKHTTSGDPGNGDPTTKVPAQVIDLTKQKITLPVTSSGALGNGNAPREVLRTELDTFKDDTYFYVQQFGGVDEVVYYAPANGATTSNTANPRCELREMAGSAGTTQASWSTTSGTHTLYLVGRVLQLPANKPQVVIMQLHDPSLDFEIIADGFSPTDSATPVTGTGTGGFCIGHRDWAGKQQYDIPLLSGVHIGDLYTVEMVVSGAGSIAMHADFGVVPSGSVTLRKTYAGGAHTGVYGKGGCYTQANSTNADSSGPKHVPSSHYPGLLAPSNAGAAIAGEPSGSGGRTAQRVFTITHA